MISLGGEPVWLPNLEDLKRNKAARPAGSGFLVHDGNEPKRGLVREESGRSR